MGPSSKILPHIPVLSHTLLAPVAGDTKHHWVLCQEPPSFTVSQPVLVMRSACLTWDIQDQATLSLGDPGPAFASLAEGRDLLGKTVCVQQTGFFFFFFMFLSED